MLRNSVTVSLWMLARGQQGAIDGFDGALREEYRIRLMELGFHPGEQVSCIQAPGLGAPHVYRVANTVFSLDDQVARYVRVRPGSND
ncbi:MAG: Fe2+ transport system protein FeoA [Halieaceae bacterium]|jgi:Fe2+ transport system protein FeoA